MAGVNGGILPHTYEPDIAAIWINDTLVGEIGVETAIAGEAGVPLVLIIGDKSGIEEAKNLVKNVESVMVKEGMGGQQGKCRNWPEIEQEIMAKAKQVAQKSPKVSLLNFGSPVKMEIHLKKGPYRSLLEKHHPRLISKKDRVILCSHSVTGAWANYWAIKDEILAQLTSKKTA